MPDAERVTHLREQADKCLRLASGITDHHTIAELRNMAMVYRTQADRLERGEEPNETPPPSVGS